MSATATAAKPGDPIKSSSPTKNATRPPPPTRGAPEAHTPPNATAKGSRRAQGWHSAVGATTGTGSSSGIRETHSNLDGKGLAHSRASSGVPRRPSVQFSEDAVDNYPTPRATSRPRTTAAGATGAANPKQDDNAFKQSMADFLTVMYGDRTAAPPPTSSAGAAGKERSGGQVSGDIPKSQRSGSPHLPPSGVKGPLVKGLTASGSNGSSSRQAPGDRIDTLVDTLVRAYSRQATSSRGDFHGTSGGPEEENPISYNRPRNNNYRRAVASPRLGRGSGANSGTDTNEVSLFVSQAMDSFIGPGGLRQHGLPSTRSVLSSLGVDKNMFGLMSFHTRSNMQDVDTVEEESETKLEPMYVGEQALFRSVGARPNMNDVSISKSMRGVIPAPSIIDEARNGGASGAGGDTQRRISNGAARRPPTDSARGHNNNSSNLSLDSAIPAGNRDCGSQPSSRIAPRSATRKFSSDSANQNNKSVTRCMSLDSKALGAAAGGGGGDDEDDSWGDDDGAPAPPPAAAPVVVSSARSLLDYSKTRHSAAVERLLGELFEEEQLKRDVVMAVERQLRGYIVSLESEERERRRGTTSGSRATKGASPAGQRGAGGRVNGAGAAVNGGPTVNSAASPPMKNMVDFFEKGSSPKPQPEAVKRLSR